MRTIRLRLLLIRQFIKTAASLRHVARLAALVLCTNLAYAQEVKMYTGCNVVLTGNIYLVVNNTAFKNNGTFVAGTSTVNFTGSTDTTISSISGTSYTTFNNLTLDKSAFGIAVQSSVGVKNILTVSAGKLYANGKLTLLSDASNTARLAAVPSSGAYIYGNAMVERYIPSRRAWRLMTAPVTNSTSIYTSWQNGGVYTVGRGLLISGPGAANGLDNGNAYSLKKWDVTTQALTPVANTYASISPTNNGSADNTGYFVFIRGDRNPNNFIVPNTNITTLTSIGNLQTGAQTFTASSTAVGFTLIGNPYASPIDFNDVTRSNLLKRFYVWDPTLNALGGYVTMDDLDNDGVYSKSVSASAQTKEIQSSQAFFVQTTANGAASLTINESAKSTTNNTYVFRPVFATTGAGKIASLQANVYLRNSDTSLLLADGALAEFGSDYSGDVNNEDALKFSNINEMIGFTRQNTALAIERRPIPNVNDTLFIKLLKTTQRSYQLQLVPQNLDQPGLTAYLEDSYLGTTNRISLSGTAAFDFAVDANAASAAPSRFRIVFKPLVISSVEVSNLTAYDLNENIKVDWKAQGDTGNIRYEVEKSTAGAAFKLMTSTDVNSAGNYSWIDESPSSGTNSYRIKSVNRNGSTKYSPVVNVLKEFKSAHFAISPNPVKGSSIHIQFNNQPKGNYQFNLINSAGQVILSTQAYISNSSNEHMLNTNTALPTGLYQLQIAGPANTTETQKVVVQQ